ncbi:hydrogen gas-evolving membrane-bound hydrogenase subunit E [Pontibacter oryzae]|uniref:DUF4040 domain-containing protein n=1 Tax=Pontibacter oryzae TaxID=2304593 RepID=A0A399SIP9_9BACT|nr:hydrogen gas-evolving membrane-bound hydrogenase subunit E [Pontibacter oryzae]RIJ41767.1 DUF4040 domain-containing protein [Pontibacter oryzae]
MLFAILIGVLFAFIAPLVYRLLGRYVAILMALLPLALFSYFISLYPRVVQGEVIIANYTWVEALAINLQFRLDGLSLIFVLLITLFGFLIMIYASAYLQGDPLLGRFYLYLTLFMTAMLGIVTADNIFCLFLFWELTSVSSYLLIGFNNTNKQARVSAWQALLVTGGGGLALFAGLILLSIASGAHTFTGLLAQKNILADHASFLPAFVLIMVGCFTKSAQFPFHFWLPNAMAAPTPVSAYLHSATMVKAGIYLLARLAPILSGPDVWFYTLAGVGSITAILGAVVAVQHTDIKAILAYTTIGALGLLVMMLGINSTLAIKGMLVFLVAHALYKGTLFLVAGAIDHCMGTRNISQLRCLGEHMIPLGIAATLAALSMAGILPFLGFIAKEMLYEATFTTPWLLGIATLSGLVFVAIALLLSYRLFWKKSSKPTPPRHALSIGLYLPPLVLGIAGLTAGLMVSSVPSKLINGAMQQIVASHSNTYKLALWHGFTPVFWLSIGTVILGVSLYRFLPFIRIRSVGMQHMYKYGPDALYHRAFERLLHGAKTFIAKLQNGYLRSYIIYIILFFCGLLLIVMWRDPSDISFSQPAASLNETQLYEFVLVALVIAALIYLLGTRSRLTSIVVMGLVGYSAALLYVLFGAPDVAATQLLIETLTVVIFVLLLHKLPAFTYLSHQFQKYKFIAIAIFFGAVMTYVMLLVQARAVDSDLKKFYGAASYEQAHGRNIVNVILVDFRGLDTLGEISVLAVAAIGIYALLRLNSEKGGKP